jgi:hypothetical protein
MKLNKINPALQKTIRLKKLDVLLYVFSRHIEIKSSLLGVFSLLGAGPRIETGPAAQKAYCLHNTLSEIHTP